jgi:2-haloacid dehalogenase
MDTYLKLRCWPDVPDSLISLKNAGIRIALLSNLTAKMLEAGINNSQLDGLFDQLVGIPNGDGDKVAPLFAEDGVRVDAGAMGREPVIAIPRLRKFDGEGSPLAGHDIALEPGPGASTRTRVRLGAR